MSGEKHHEIPRSKIPWYPSVDYEKCISCGKCVDFCSLGVFAFEEKEGEKIVVVKNPYSCVVLCSGCDEVCPIGAIKHPSRKETQRTIRELQRIKARVTR
jgi:NAD-dependent dihydropyrimidine dehydrogenase PreA subunit